TWSKQSSGSGARLWGVAFSDATHGWAVGYDSLWEKTVILVTTDGGATWSAQSPGTTATASLVDVAFVDATHGWAVGAGGAILAAAKGDAQP
ncbi:MAG: hypothetical protein WCP98_16610, partial [Actinomycetes bacterium]